MHEPGRGLGDLAKKDLSLGLWDLKAQGLVASLGFVLEVEAWE